MMKGIRLSDRIVTGLIESIVLVLYFFQQVSISTAIVLGFFGLIFLSTSAIAAVLPSDADVGQSD